MELGFRVLFMTSCFAPRRSPRIDEMYPARAFRKPYDQQPMPRRLPYDDLTALIEGVVRVVEDLRLRIGDGRQRFRERDAVVGKASKKNLGLTETIVKTTRTSASTSAKNSSYPGSVRATAAGATVVIRSIPIRMAAPLARLEFGY